MSSSSLIEIASIAQTTSYTIVTCIALLTYDYIITLPREIQYVWNSRYSPGKILFWIIRYLGFIDVPFLVWKHLSPAPTPSSCIVADYMITWSQALASVCAYAVFALRTWAIWERGRTTGILILATYTVSLVVSVYFLVKFTWGTDVGPNIPAVPGCEVFYTDAASGAVVIAYVTLACYEAIIFFATLIPGIRYFRNKNPALTAILYRDALLGSTLLFTVAVLNAAIGLAGVEYFSIINSVGRVLWAIVPGRVILNLREATMATDPWDIPSAVTPIVAISFSITGGGEERQQDADETPLPQAVGR